MGNGLHALFVNFPLASGQSLLEDGMLASLPYVQCSAALYAICQVGCRFIVIVRRNGFLKLYASIIIAGDTHLFLKWQKASALGALCQDLQSFLTLVSRKALR